MKSHQNNKSTYDQLPWQAQLNCDCNKQATLVQECNKCIPKKRNLIDSIQDTQLLDNKSEIYLSLNSYL